MEEWKTVEGFPDYAVSNIGRVKRLTARTCAKAGHILKASPRCERGYLVVDLCIEGKRKTMQVHRLVAIAFHGAPTEEAPEVNHINGNRGDNRAENLEWICRSGNVAHAYRNGLACAKGERNGQAKLTRDQVEQIRAAATGRRGEQVELARRFNVSTTTIRGVISGRVWA